MFQVCECTKRVEHESPAQSPDPDPTEHLWNKLEQSFHLTSMADPKATLQNVKKSLPRRVEVIQHTHTSVCQMPIYYCQYSLNLLTTDKNFNTFTCTKGDNLDI